MPDKKLTDNEILKALECCADEMGCIKGCPCFNPKSKGSHCTVSKKLKLEKLTIDLIKRQQAEIERLHKEVGYWEAETKEARADIDQAVAEAYKECVEKVKDEKFKTSVDAYTDAYILGEDDLDNLLKELVGDNQ